MGSLEMLTPFVVTSGITHTSYALGTLSSATVSEMRLNTSQLAAVLALEMKLFPDDSGLLDSRTVGAKDVSFHAKVVLSYKCARETFGMLSERLTGVLPIALRHLDVKWALTTFIRTRTSFGC